MAGTWGSWGDSEGTSGVVEDEGVGVVVIRVGGCWLRDVRSCVFILICLGIGMEMPFPSLLLLLLILLGLLLLLLLVVGVMMGTCRGFIFWVFSCEPGMCGKSGIWEIGWVGTGCMPSGCLPKTGRWIPGKTTLGPVYICCGCGSGIPGILPMGAFPLPLRLIPIPMLPLLPLLLPRLLLLMLLLLLLLVAIVPGPPEEVIPGTIPGPAAIVVLILVLILALMLVLILVLILVLVVPVVVLGAPGGGAGLAGLNPGSGPGAL